MDEQRNLRIIFSEILSGYSHTQDNHKDIFIRHLKSVNLHVVDWVYEFYLQKAIAEKVPTKLEREEFLIKEEIWSKDKNDKIDELKKLVSDLNDNYSMEYLKSKRENLLKNIKEIEQDIDKLESEKNLLIGHVAETYAHKKSNEEYVKISFFKDKDFKIPLFTEEEFNELDENELNKLTRIYNKRTEHFNSSNLKKISICNFFLNTFYLCNDSVFEFYGKPVVDLTMYQAEIFGYGRYFKSIISEFGEKIPKSLMNSPDQLMNWIDCNKNAKRVMGGDGSSGTGIFGATKEDLKFLGIETTANRKLTEELKKHGGRLDMKAMMKLDGQ